MKRLFPHICLALCFIAPASSATAQSISPTARPNLIPLRPANALSLAKFDDDAPAPGKRNDTALAVQTSHGQLIYDFYTANGPTIQINSMTGEIDALLVSPRSLPSSSTNKPLREFNTAYLQQQAIDFVRKAYPRYKALNKIEAHKSVPGPDAVDDSFTWDVDFSEKTDTGPTTLNRCTVSVRRDTGQVVRYMLARYAEPRISQTPAFTGPQAIELARWYLTKGAPTTFQLLLPSQYTLAQRQALEMPATAAPPSDDLSLAIDEDPWLDQQLRWTINLNVGRVVVDATTGNVISTDASPWVLGPDAKKYMQLFIAAQPTSQPQPPKLPPPTLLAQFCDVNFNGDTLAKTPGPGALHYPPIVKNGVPLISAGYFPSFMIALDVHGSQIHLSGQLKIKGKKALLTIGKTAALIEERPVTLSAAPEIIGGKLFLPAELLQLVNGIPVKWDRRENCLTVTTKNLRRD